MKQTVECVTSHTADGRMIQEFPNVTLVINKKDSTGSLSFRGRVEKYKNITVGLWGWLVERAEMLSSEIEAGTL